MYLIYHDFVYYVLLLWEWNKKRKMINTSAQSPTQLAQKIANAKFNSISFAGLYLHALEVVMD